MGVRIGEKTAGADYTKVTFLQLLAKISLNYEMNSAVRAGAVMLEFLRPE